jgi:hypothetical protein
MRNDRRRRGRRRGIALTGLSGTVAIVVVLVRSRGRGFSRRGCESREGSVESARTPLIPEQTWTPPAPDADETPAARLSDATAPTVVADKSDVRGRWGRRLGVVLASLAAVLALLVLFVPSVFSSVLSSNSLVPHPDRYTELYFTDPERVLNESDRRRIVIPFTIENDGAQRWLYRYEVTIGAGGGTGVVVATGEVRVGPGQAVSQVVDIARRLRGRLRVQVTLPGVTSGILFWTSR